MNQICAIFNSNIRCISKDCADPSMCVLNVINRILICSAAKNVYIHNHRGIYWIANQGISSSVNANFFHEFLKSNYRASALGKFYLFHPVAPFISEELWHLLGYGNEADFIQKHSPGLGGDLLKTLRENGIKLINSKVQDVAQLREFVVAVRGLKSQANQANRRDSKIVVLARDAVAQAILETNKDKLFRVAGLQEMTFETHSADRPGSVTPLGTVILEMGTNIDVGAEKIRLTKELEKIEKAVSAGEAKLSNETFVSKAPPAILDGARKQLAESVAKRDEIKRMLSSLN